MVTQLAFLTTAREDEATSGDTDGSGTGVPDAPSAETSPPVSVPDELPSGWTRVTGQRGNGDEYLRHYLGPWNEETSRRKMCKTLAEVHKYIALHLPTQSSIESVPGEKLAELRSLEEKVERMEEVGDAVTEEADKTEADEDVEVEEVTICDELYYTDNAEAGTIYACLQDGTVGDEVGHFEDGHAFFS